MWEAMAQNPHMHNSDEEGPSAEDFDTMIVNMDFGNLIAMMDDEERERFLTVLHHDMGMAAESESTASYVSPTAVVPEVNGPDCSTLRCGSTP